MPSMTGLSEALLVKHTMTMRSSREMREEEEEEEKEESLL